MFGMIRTPQITIDAVPDYERYFQALVEATPALRQEAQINGLQALAPPLEAGSPIKRVHLELPLPPGVFKKEILQPLNFPLTLNNFFPVLNLIARLSTGYESEEFLWALLTPCINALETAISQIPSPETKIQLYKTITHAAYQFGNFWRDRKDGNVDTNFSQALTLFHHCCDYSTSALNIFQQCNYSDPKLYIESCLNMAEVIIANIYADVSRNHRYKINDAMPYLRRATNIVTMILPQAIDDQERRYVIRLKNYCEWLLSKIHPDDRA